MDSAGRNVGDVLQQQVDAADDGEIDQLVYDLYGLSDDEVRLAEKATGRRLRACCVML